MLFGLLYRSRYLYWFASTIPFAGQWRVWQRLVIPRILGRDVSWRLAVAPGTLLADMVRRAILHGGGSLAADGGRRSR